MEVQVISKEFIKPSSPTPPHLQTYKISFIDQLLLGCYIPIISFYPKRVAHLDIGGAESLTLLKTSLSETLTRFYPLAGRVKDGVSIDCNDEGVFLSTARVNREMAEVLREPKIELFYQFAPPESSYGSAQLAFQLNVFACGGLAICVFYLHRMIDAITMAALFKSWAADYAIGSQGSSLDSALTVEPDLYTAPSLFPAMSPLPEGFTFVMERALLKEGKGVVQRFVFDAAAISALKVKATSKRVSNPTRVEVVSAFIWKRAMAASEVVWGEQQPSFLNYVVDLRRRMVPPLSEYCIGNLLWKVITHYDPIEGEEIGELDGFVGLIRAAMKKSKEEFVPKLQEADDDGRRSTDKAMMAMRKFLEEYRETCSQTNLNPYTFTSWSRIGLNEVDFGWGKPIWVSQMGAEETDYKDTNLVTLMDGSDGGIEAWMIMDQRVMAVLERDEEFLAYASSNPGFDI